MDRLLSEEVELSLTMHAADDCFKRRTTKVWFGEVAAEPEQARHDVGVKIFGGLLTIFG